MNNLFEEKRDRRNKRNRHKAWKNKKDTTQTTEPILKIEKLCQKIVITDPETSEDEIEQSSSFDSLFLNNMLDDNATLDEILLGKRKIIGGHFQFKREKQWEEDEYDEPLNEKFTLDTNEIAKSLSQTAVNDLISTPTFLMYGQNEECKCIEEKAKGYDIPNDELIMSILRGISDRQVEMQENDKIINEGRSDKIELEHQLDNDGKIGIEESSNKNELEDWLDNVLDD